MEQTRRRMGVLEAMARADLDTLLDRVATGYRPGSLERLAVLDPEWRAALERAEAEAGALLRELREADAALARWRRTRADLTRLWERVHTVPEDESALEVVHMLDDVA